MSLNAQIWPQGAEKQRFKVNVVVVVGGGGGGGGSVGQDGYKSSWRS